MVGRPQRGQEVIYRYYAVPEAAGRQLRGTSKGQCVEVCQLPIGTSKASKRSHDRSPKGLRKWFISMVSSNCYLPAGG
eukprot:scaffold3190_cov409-Prasinococcus_capsulatus_cf.AAC.13